MAESGITCRTFYNRMSRCYYYKEKETYIKSVSLLFKRIFMKLNSTSEFIPLFTKELNSKSFTGTSSVYTEDKETVRDYMVKCASNIDILINKFDLTNIYEEYNYRYRIRDRIGGILRINKRTFNLHFSYTNLTETQKVLDFYHLNNYLYNMSSGKDNDCLIMCVPGNFFIIVKHDPEDYTMKRGFISSIESNKNRKRGEYCITCKNKCESSLINGINRLEMFI